LAKEGIKDETEGEMIEERESESVEVEVTLGNEGEVNETESGKVKVEVELKNEETGDETEGEMRRELRRVLTVGCGETDWKKVDDDWNGRT
jgi:hypothetical protein